jgi:hypothetical protein
MATAVRVSLFSVAPLPRPLGVDPAAVEDLEVWQGGTPHGRDLFRLTLRLRRTGLEYDLLTEPGLEVNQRLAATALVGETPCPLFDGVILDHRFLPGPSPCESRLVVTGEDITVRLDEVEENRSYPRLADGMIATQVVARHARLGLVPPTPAPGGLVDRTTIQTETDFKFLTRLARR